MKDRDRKLPTPEQDDELSIVCMPVAQTDDVIVGSRKRNCATCSEPIWVSPATEASVKDRVKKKFVCMDCAVKAMEKDKDTEVLPVNPAQIEELRKHFDE